MSSNIFQISAIVSYKLRRQSRTGKASEFQKFALLMNPHVTVLESPIAVRPSLFYAQNVRIKACLLDISCAQYKVNG